MARRRRWFLLIFTFLLGGCGSDKLQEALNQEQLTEIRERLVESGIEVEFADLGPDLSGRTVRDDAGNVTSLQINSDLEGGAVEVIKQYIAHEEVHAQTGPGNSFEEERDSRLQEADIWRAVKGALRDVNCDADEDIIYRPDGTRRSDAEVRRRLREEYGYPF